MEKLEHVTTAISKTDIMKLTTGRSQHEQGQVCNGSIWSLAPYFPGLISKSKWRRIRLEPWSQTAPSLLLKTVCIRSGKGEKEGGGRVRGKAGRKDE
ncbi:hypothetical protein BaRGS_00028652 [Batillaria attramentaria]|uniref:Uncharacterized protein n=1 Tax=Batillaria attramentaria TaxID=370345 RepID=A0ABD0JZF5_9CAEN